jgi:DNA-binding NarL/FixJ family response regulator
MKIKIKSELLYTPREINVLCLLLLGRSNKEIAKELKISVETSKEHVSNILKKAKMDSRVKLIVSYYTEALKEPEGLSRFERFTKVL